MRQSRIIVILLLLVSQIAIITRTTTAAERPTKRIGLPPPAATVTKLYAMQQGDGIMLRWETVAGCDGYRIYHEAGDELHAGSSWVDVTESGYLFSGVVPSGHYSFRVAALYGKSERAISQRVTVIMKDKKTPVRSDRGK